MNDIMCPACGLYVCQHSEKLCELLKTAKQHESDVQHVGMPFSSIRSQILPSPEDVGRSKGAAAMTAENKRRERPADLRAQTLGGTPFTAYEIREANALFEMLEVENRRLKQALNQIIGIPHKIDGGDWDEIEQAQDIALEALKEQQP